MVKRFVKNLFILFLIAVVSSATMTELSTLSEVPVSAMKEAPQPEESQLAEAGSQPEPESEKPQPDAPALSMHVIDVGQGLALLFESGGSYLLFDGGGRNYTARVTEYLEKQGVKKIDYAIASHYDSDHINGIIAALNAFEVGTVIAPDYIVDNYVYVLFGRAIRRQGLEITRPEVGERYTFGSASFTILAPADEEYEAENDYSVAVRVECGNKSFIVTGDATAFSESEMLAGSQELDSDILVVGHHGSSGSTSQKFLDEVSPEAAVVSCELNNEFRHPSRQVMRRLQEAEIPVFRTDKQGDFVISTDGYRLIFSEEPCNDYSYGLWVNHMYAVTNVNVRSGSSTDSQILGVLKTGDSIAVTEIQGDWASVTYNGEPAYVAAAYLAEQKTPDGAETSDSSDSGQAEDAAFDKYDNPEQQQTTVAYVLNIYSGKFHRPSCDIVKKIAPYNYAVSNESRDTLIARGYIPCKNCAP